MITVNYSKGEFAEQQLSCGVLVDHLRGLHQWIVLDVTRPVRPIDRLHVRHEAHVEAHLAHVTRAEVGPAVVVTGHTEHHREHANTTDCVNMRTPSSV